MRRQFNSLLRALGLSESSLENLAPGVLTHHANWQFVEIETDTISDTGTYTGWWVRDNEGELERQDKVLIQPANLDIELATCAYYLGRFSRTVGELGVFIVGDAPPAAESCDGGSGSGSGSGNGSGAGGTDPGSGVCVGLTDTLTIPAWPPRREGDEFVFESSILTLKRGRICSVAPGDELRLDACCDDGGSGSGSGDESGSGAIACSTSDVLGAFRGTVTIDYGGGDVFTFTDIDFTFVAGGYTSENLTCDGFGGNARIACVDGVWKWGVNTIASPFTSSAITITSGPNGSATINTNELGSFCDHGAAAADVTLTIYP